MSSVGMVRREGVGRLGKGHGIAIPQNKMMCSMQAKFVRFGSIFHLAGKPPKNYQKKRNKYKATTRGSSNEPPMASKTRQRKPIKYYTSTSTSTSKVVKDGDSDNTPNLF